MRLRRPLPAVQGDTLHIVGVGDNRIGKYFTLPIVNDRFKWKNLSKKSEGYDIREGKHTKMLFLKKNMRLNPKDVKKVSY